MDTVYVLIRISDFEAMAHAEMTYLSAYKNKDDALRARASLINMTTVRTDNDDMWSNEDIELYEVIVRQDGDSDASRHDYTDIKHEVPS